MRVRGGPCTDVSQSDLTPAVHTTASAQVHGQPRDANPKGLGWGFLADVPRRSLSCKDTATVTAQRGQHVETKQPGLTAVQVSF